MSLLNPETRFMTRIFTLILGIFLLLPAPMLWAQSPYSAAYRVNSSVITYYELDQMQRFLETIGRVGEDPQKTALDTLINARLLDQEAKRIGIQDDPIALQNAFNRLTDEPDRLRAELSKNGVAQDTIDTYIQAQMLLSTYLDLKGVEIEISPDEISSRILQIPDQVVPVVYIAEIVMPYAEYGGRIPARLKLVEVMNDLRSGRKSFQQTAREISRSPTASKGGVIGPIPREALNGQIAAVVNRSAPGQISSPIETEGAIILLQYVGPSEVRNSLPRTSSVSYTELFVPANGNLAKSREGARALQRAYPTCGQASGVTNASVKKDVAVNSLSSGISLALARLETGENTIFERENGTSVLYLCERSVIVPAEYQEGVEAMAANEAARDQARGVMQDLRNIANITKVQ